jgi:amino acid transporter
MTDPVPSGAAEPPALRSLPRRLGVIGIWLLMINGMIGAGIFGAPAELARLTGQLSPLLFLLGALLMAPVMLCFSQLGGSVRGSGGPARYLDIAFGPIAGFQGGWALWVARVTAFGANLNFMPSSTSSCAERCTAAGVGVP